MSQGLFLLQVINDSVMSKIGKKQSSREKVFRVKVLGKQNGLFIWVSESWIDQSNMILKQYLGFMSVIESRHQLAMI